MTHRPKTVTCRFIAWMERVDARHREKRAIETMDERMLRDIGMTREQLLRSARESRERDFAAAMSHVRGAA